MKLGNLLSNELLCPVLQFPRDHQQDFFLTSRTGLVSTHSVDAEITTNWISELTVFKNSAIPDQDGFPGFSTGEGGRLSVRNSSDCGTKPGSGKAGEPSVFRSPMIYIYKAKFKSEPKPGKFTKVDMSTALRLQTLLSPSSAGVKVAIEDLKELEIAMRTKMDVSRTPRGDGSEGRASPAADGVDGFLAI
jgi:hypothetical protein